MNGYLGFLALWVALALPAAILAGHLLHHASHRMDAAAARRFHDSLNLKE